MYNLLLKDIVDRKGTQFRNSEIYFIFAIYD